MSDNRKMAKYAAQIPDQIFRFMDLPRELRDRVYGFAAVKPNSHIGQADPNGIECALGASGVQFHFPSGCRHPVHEKTQLIQDFLDYRSLNFALTSQQVYTELSTLFFKRNGFELRDANQLRRFFLLVGSSHASLIQELRLFHNIELTIFYFAWVDRSTLYQMLEQEYLNDDEPGSQIVHVLKHIMTCENLKKFELIYRFELPPENFSVANGGYIGTVFNLAHPWCGQSMWLEVHTKNVLKKLRQDHGKEGAKKAGKEADKEINVELGSFKANDLAKKVSAIKFGKNGIGIYRFALVSACVAHAENCIEWAVDVHESVMDAVRPSRGPRALA